MRDFPFSRDRGWAGPPSTVHSLSTLPVSLTVACTGLGFAYLSAGLSQPFEVVQTLAQTGYKADSKGKERERSQALASADGPVSVAHVVRALYSKHGYKALWQGHSTATWLTFAQRALPPVMAFTIHRLAVRPLLAFFPPRLVRPALNHPLTKLIFLLDATAFTSVLLVPLSRRLTHEIVALARHARPFARDPLAASDGREPATPPSLLAGVKAYIQRTVQMWDDPLLTLPVLAAAILPLLVDVFAGWALWRCFHITGGAPRQLGLLLFRLASLSFLTPLSLLRRRLALRPLPTPGALEAVDITALDVEVRPVKRDAWAELVGAFDEVVGPAPLELSWARLGPVYAGLEVDVLRVLGGAVGGFVGWRMGEGRRGRGRRWEWREWRGAWKA